LNCFEKGQDIRRFSPTLSMDNVKTLTPLIAAALLITSVAVLLTQIPQAAAANDWVVFTIKTADDTSTINAKIFNNTIQVTQPMLQDVLNVTSINRKANHKHLR
jgi:hypothetical protein